MAASSWSSVRSARWRRSATTAAAAAGDTQACQAAASARVSWWLWPMPVITGTGAVAIAVTTGALSKGLSWASSPPPRATRMTWLPTPALRIWAAMRAGAASPSSGAGKWVASTWWPLCWRTVTASV